MRFLSPLPGKSDEVAQIARDVNDKGIAVGLAGASSSGAIGVSYFGAVVWEPGRSPRRFPLVPGHSHTDAVAVNRHGDVLVGAGYGDPWDAMPYIEYVGKRPTETPQLAFLWRGDKIMPLGIWDVHALNDHGDVLATAPTNSDGTPSVSDRPRQKEHLYLLSGRGAKTVGPGYPRGLNNRGQVIYTYGDEAWLWSGTRRRLPRLPRTETATANALNDRGQIVGRCDDRLCLWQGSRVYDLSGVVSLPKAWGLDAVNAINNQGVILSTARRTDNEGYEERSCLLLPVSRAGRKPEVRR